MFSFSISIMILRAESCYLIGKKECSRADSVTRVSAMGKSLEDLGYR